MHMMGRKRIAIAVLLALGSALTFPAGAGAVAVMECQLVATATQSVIAAGPPAVYDWDVIMIGTCTGDRKGPYSAFGSADGTSIGLGLCDGSLVIQNLDLDVVIFLDSTKGPQYSKFLQERWSAPVTTFPVVTPFLIENVAGPAPVLTGAGALMQYLGLNCSGSPSTLIFNVRVK